MPSDIVPYCSVNKPIYFYEVHLQLQYWCNATLQYHALCECCLWQVWQPHGMKESLSNLPRFGLREVCNTLRHNSDWAHFPDDIFKSIFLKMKTLIAINISLKFVPSGPSNNNPALVQVIVWRRPGDNPLSEPTMVNLHMRHSASMT